MARGQARAPSQHAYRGEVGTTRTATVHYSCRCGTVHAVRVHHSVDVVADPELGRRLLGQGEALNAVRCPDGTGGTGVITTPVVYHDPAAELFVLVLAEGDRHRELEARGALYAELAADHDAAVPPYVREFTVAYGPEGLSAELERAAEAVLATARTAESARELERERTSTERRRTELGTREAALTEVRAELDRRARDLDRKAAELDGARGDHDRLRAERDRARAELVEVRADAERLRGELATAHAELEHQHGDHVTDPAVPRAPSAPGEVTSPYELTIETPIDDEPPATVTAPQLPAGADPITAEVADRPIGTPDGWLAAFASSALVHAVTVPSAAGTDDLVRVALRSPRSLGRGPLDLRVQLARTPAHALIALTVGSPEAVRGLVPDHRATALLDVNAEGERRALVALERGFSVMIDLVADGRWIRRAVIRAPLAENIGYLVRAAQVHLGSLSSDGTIPSATRGRALASAPDFNLLGVRHPEAAEFRDDKLALLVTANQVRRALAMARRFSRPSGEDYLVTVRGYSLSRWRGLRRAVLERAVTWGLWMGGELAQVAVSEGLARSRKDLVARLEVAFATTLADPLINDLDPEAADDNSKALAAEAKALGRMREGTRDDRADRVAERAADPRFSVNVSSHDAAQAGAAVPARTAPIDSETEAVVSGTIDVDRPSLRANRPSTARTHGLVQINPAVSRSTQSTAELLALLEDREQRVVAAIELCQRGDPAAVRPVFNVIRRLGRSEAVRVLASTVKLGPAAAPALTAGLASSKAFLRHGCALSLALLRTDAGTEAVVDLLLHEPTEIWREIARAVGQVGPSALMVLAARFGRLGERATPADRERVAWAMAQVAVRGGKPAVETLSQGTSVVAPVARAALELMETAARDDLQVRGAATPRDVTVNRAFSRRFFEALDNGTTDPGVEHTGTESSGPTELIDDADLLDAEDGEDLAELDENDLVHPGLIARIPVVGCPGRAARVLDGDEPGKGAHPWRGKWP